MTGARGTGKKANAASQSPNSSQRNRPSGFETLCSNVGDLCSTSDENDEDVIPKLQEMLRDQADQPGLDKNTATAVAVTQLLLPVMGMTNRSVEKRLAQTETSINKLRASVRLNAYENDRLQQYTRRENIRISGIPEVDGEQLKGKIVELGNEMGLNIVERDINACHRLGPKHSGRSRAIIVRFFARDTKHDFLVNKNKLKDKVSYRNVYINEDLTPLRSKMLHYVKRQDGVESAYTREGKVICRIRDGSRITIETPDDLFKLGLTNIDYIALGLSALE